MFIFSQIVKHNWRWHIWVCLLGDSGKWQLHESCCVRFGRQACAVCWATRALSLSPARQSANRQAASGTQFNFAPWAISPSRLLQALQLKMHHLSEEGGYGDPFKDLSQLFRCPFDPVDGRGIISHVQVCLFVFGLVLIFMCVFLM